MEINKRSRYRNYLSIQVLVMILVFGIFKLIPDVQVASVVAGSLFILTSAGILVFEMKHADFLKRFTFWGTLAFIVLSGIPIMALRLMNWGIPFDQLALFGIPGPTLHKFSNYLFLFMVICLFIDINIEQRQKRQNA